MVHFVVQFYNDSNPQRNAENEYCLKKNLNNPFIDKLHVVLENKTVLPSFCENHPKVIVSSSGDDRLTFRKVFE